MKGQSFTLQFCGPIQEVCCSDGADCVGGAKGEFKPWIKRGFVWKALQWVVGAAELGC